MFNLQGSEIIFILLLALVVLGPEKLPGAIRRFTQTYAELRKMSSGFQSELKSTLDEPMKEMRETADLVRRSADPARLLDEEEAAAAAAAERERDRRSRAESEAENAGGDGGDEGGATAESVVDEDLDPFADPVDDPLDRTDAGPEDVPSGPSDTDDPGPGDVDDTDDTGPGPDEEADAGDIGPVDLDADDTDRGEGAA